MLWQTAKPIGLVDGDFLTHPTFFKTLYLSELHNARLECNSDKSNQGSWEILEDLKETVFVDWI